MSCLNPKEMVASPDRCKDRLKRLLQLLVSCKRLSDRDCDVYLQQYLQFLDNIPSIGTDRFINSNAYQDSLDTCYSEVMKSDSYSRLYEVVKMVLILSHGQATVERGVSVNKEIEVENLQEQGLVAQRLICDYVSKIGSVLEIPITKELLTHVSGARDRYSQYLHKQSEMKITEVKKNKENYWKMR